MKPNKKINIRLEKNLGLPTVYIKFRYKENRSVFPLLIDTSVRHNLLDPCMMEWEIVETEPTAEELAAPKFLEDGSWNWNHRDPVVPIHQEKGKKRIMCKDGVRRSCDMIKLDFFIEDRKYSELFAIDPSMCRYFHFKKKKEIVGVLGNDFLRKYRWVLDYSEMKPHR